MKKGLSLAINTVVILIISITVFAMAIAFLTKIGTGANQAKDELSEAAIRQFEENIPPGTKVAIIRDTKEVNSGSTVTFNVYILSILDGQAKFDFEIKAGKAYDARGEEIADSLDVTDVFVPGELVLGKNEHGIKKLLVDVPGGKSKGKYVMNVNVICKDNPQCPTPTYDGYPHKIYIDVI